MKNYPGKKMLTTEGALRLYVLPCGGCLNILLLFVGNSAIGFQDLSPALQQEVQDLQKRMAVELQPLVLESTLTMQKLLETESHEARCKLLRFFVDAERKRLSTKKSLAGMFAGDTAELSSIPEAERLAPKSEKSDDKEEDDDNTPPTEGSQSIITDEPDAWG